MTDAPKSFVCSKNMPWSPELWKGSVIHPDAKCVREYDDYYDGCDLEDYECPHCGTKWTKEIAR